MKQHYTVILCVMSIFSSFGQLLPMYPLTDIDTVTDDYFGTKVSDPYRWLENENSPKTKEWVEREMGFTNSILNDIPFTDMIQKDLTTLCNYPKQSIPQKVGRHYYYYKNNGLQNQSILYQSDLDFKNEQVLLDPNKLSKEGTVAISGISFSKSGQYLAYLLSNAGSDWQELRIMTTDTKRILQSDRLKYLKFSNIAWVDDKGFYYSRFSKPNEGKKYSDQSRSQEVFYHAIGSSQSSDILVYANKKKPLQYISPSITEDGSFLILSISEGTSGQEIMVKSLKESNAAFTTLIEGFDHEAQVIDNIKGNLLVLTNVNAPNYKLVLIDPKNTDKKYWKTLINEKLYVLKEVTTSGKQLFAHYIRNVNSEIVQYDYAGKKIRTVDVPYLGSISGFEGKSNDKVVFYSVVSFVVPNHIYKYNIETGKSVLHSAPSIKEMNLQDFETKQIFAPSNDSTEIPIFITYKKGIELNGNNPTLLYGYGGFNIPITPSFSPSILYFIAQGGIYAVANIRGGSEYGEKWHQEGMLQNKQNVFNDFIKASEFLILEKYTSQQKLAIMGRSNGGLLVGACLTQRPDLYKVAIPQVGVLDMLRYHLFTVGWGWKTEYGSSEKENEFKYLYAYSPYHNIKIGGAYPATMIVTADHDDRVVPAHSFKFAAQLQAAQTISTAPIVLKVTTNAGHGSGKPLEKWIQDESDIYAFIMYYLGMNPKPLTDISNK